MTLTAIRFVATGQHRRRRRRHRRIVVRGWLEYEEGKNVGCKPARFKLRRCCLYFYHPEHSKRLILAGRGEAGKNKTKQNLMTIKTSTDKMFCLFFDRSLDSGLAQLAGD